MRKALLFVGLLLIVAAIIVWQYAGYAFKSDSGFNVPSKIITIPSQSDFQDVVAILVADSVITDTARFRWLAEKKNYPGLVKAGRYVINKSMTSNQVINRLRSGDQRPVQLTFNSVRTVEELAGRLSRKLEADSLEILSVLRNAEIAESYGFTSTTFPTMFIPNTYEVWWNESPEDLVARMAWEYKAFWNSERIAKAGRIGLSQSEVAILASIVKAETIKWDEAPRIAGVYVNRLKKNMALQADPTLIFALGDFSITRVLDKHKKIDSPYNTYKYAGLPPGPINIPEPVYLDAVLNAEKHKYLFFCARPDFTGYHNFSETYRQHQQYAREYQRELNNRRIYK